MIMDQEETKIDKAISWIVIIGFLVMAYNFLGICADEIREMLKHVF